jgi:predicted GNAT family acetyltransferase
MHTIETAITAELPDSHVDALKRLTLNIDGHSIAFVEFYLFGTVAIVTYTEVEFLHQGKGLGSIAVSAALRHFRSKHWKVVPICGFFLQQLRQHPEYVHLLTPTCRRIFAV